MEKIVVFGIGKIFRERKNELPFDKIVAMLDRNKELQGKKICNITVYEPEKIIDIQYDIVILMSEYYAVEMRTMLLELGCDNKKIMHYQEYFGIKRKTIFNDYKNDCIKHLNFQKGAVIISNQFGYHGGAIVALNTALALKNCGIDVVLLSDGGEQEFINEVYKLGIVCIVQEGIKWQSETDLRWIEKFKYIIVNTFPMIRCALTLCQRRKVLLWLHESDKSYDSMEYWREDIEKGIISNNLQLVAVSEIAKKNFYNRYNIKKNINILPCGLKDNMCIVDKKNKEKLIFAFVGQICGEKGCDILLNALKILDSNVNDSFECWIIGQVNDDNGKKLLQEIVQIPNCRYLGELSRNSIHEVYGQIDVLVVPSKAETLSLTAIEAMMNKKIVLSTNRAGVSSYIADKRNGILFESEDSEALVRQMKWCLENRKVLKFIGEQARETYKKYFDLKIFEKNINKSLSNL